MRIIILFTLFWFNLALSDHYSIPDVNFIESMSDGNEIAKYIMSITPKNLKLFEDYYEAKKPSKMPYQEKPLIPKVMHQIWLGSSSIPPLYKHYLNECQKLHPDWEFKFWTEKDIDELGLEYRDVYDKALNYAGRSDIARYEILYRFGGVYRDMDVKCFRPIDDLNHKYTFFVPIDFPFEDAFDVYKMISINNGIIGSDPGNIILKDALDIIRKDFDKHLYDFTYDLHTSAHRLAIKASLLPLTQSFVQNTSINDKNIALPATYFWSLLDRQFHIQRNFGFKKYMTAEMQNIIYGPTPNAFHSLRPESLMFHNVGKREIRYCDFYYGSYMNDSSTKKITKKLNKLQQKMLSIFKTVYKERVPKEGMLALSGKNKIPLIIHFIVFDDSESNSLNQNLSIWKTLNADFDIQIWDKNKLSKEFDDLIFDATDKENIRFYYGLKVLEKFGGAYADFKAKPYKPIFELNNQYNFYAVLMPLNNNKQFLSFSHKFFGVQATHPIITKTLSQVNFENLEKLDRILVNETYKGIYLNGKNVVLPAVYSGPTLLNNQGIFDRVVNRYFKREKSLPIYSDFAIVE